MLSSLTWYMTRASGLVAYVLLVASMVAGLALSTRVHGRQPKRTWVLDVHRTLGALALMFLGVHVASLLMDSFVTFDVVDAVIPFASGWKPAAVAGGVVAMWLLVAVEVSSRLRRRLPARVWRRIHLASFGAFALATVHFVMAGTDTSSPLAMFAIVGGTATIVGLTGLRIWLATQATSGQAGSGSALGRRTTKRAPGRSPSSKRTDPPCAATTAATIERPSPKPPLARDRD